jgi:hypothetical protein
LLFYAALGVALHNEVPARRRNSGKTPRGKYEVKVPGETALDIAPSAPSRPARIVAALMIVCGLMLLRVA